MALLRGWTIAAVSLLAPVVASAALTAGLRPQLPAPGLSPFSYLSQAQTLEWGCPVADKVEAETAPEALQRISEQCVDSVTQEAARRPDVLSVIETRVTRPDVEVNRQADGFHLTGTFYLETIVEKRTSLKVE